MKNSIVVKTVLVGATNSGKSAFMSILQKKPVPTTYLTTICFDVCIVEDDKFKYKVFELSGGAGYADAGAFYWQSGDVLLFFINPQGDGFEVESKQFLANLTLKYNATNIASIMVVFSHEDEWQDNPAAALRINQFTDQLHSHTSKPFSSLRFSAITASSETLLAAIQKLVYNKEDDRLFSLNVQEKLKAYQIASGKRILKPDSTRRVTVSKLQTSLQQSLSLKEIRSVLIEAARDIREAKPDGKLKYGINFFGYHYGDYHDSELFQLLSAELEKLEPRLKLDELSEPQGNFTSQRQILK